MLVDVPLSVIKNIIVPFITMNNDRILYIFSSK